MALTAHDDTYTVVVPVLHGAYLDRQLTAEGVPHRTWSRSETAAGKAPVGWADARRGLRRYYAINVLAIAPMVIESPLDQDAVIARIRELTDDPSFWLYVREAFPQNDDDEVSRLVRDDSMTPDDIARLEDYADMLELMGIR